jgi:hypothetical protein
MFEPKVLIVRGLGLEIRFGSRERAWLLYYNPPNLYNSKLKT